MRKIHSVSVIITLFSFLTINAFSQTIWDGPSKTFTKENYADWTRAENQDRIMDDIWITRADSRPIFNATEDKIEPSPADTRWAYGSIADGVENLTFKDWTTTIEWNPPGMIDKNMVLFLVSDSIYIDITFTSWTSGDGNGGGGFSYERSTGSPSQTLWTDTKMTFTKADSADWTLAENQDRITDNVWLTRANDKGLFNIVKEPEYDRSGGLAATMLASPTDTKWAWGSIADGVENLEFSDWATTIDWNPLDMLNQNMVLYLITDNIYIDITFTSWTSGRDNGGGGFSYERSTGDPSETLWTGPKITVTKTDSADWTLAENQDHITDNVWLTRADNQGLFNIVKEDYFVYSSYVPSKTLWAFGTTDDGVENLDFNYFLETVNQNPPSMLNQNMVMKLVPYDIYIDITFTSWTSGEESYAPSGTKWAFGSIADGVENLTFDTWINTIDGGPKSTIDNPMVLFLVDDSIYIDITFTSWTSGQDNGGGGFSYERSTGDPSETLWTGPKTTFTKNDYADWTLAENQDRITDNVWITRADNQSIFNIARENSYNEATGGGGFSYTRSTNPAASVEPKPAGNNQLSCYPNPANDMVTFNFDFVSPSPRIEIYTIGGRLVTSKLLSESQSLPVINLNNGLYIYRIMDNGKIYNGKIIVRH